MNVAQIAGCIAVVLAGLTSATSLGATSSGDFASSQYSVALSSDQTESRRLLPVQGTDLPIVSSIDSSSDTHPIREPSPTVEAIPTPTAFQTGLLALITLGVWRFIRKLRLA